jgi:uncharacterized protein
MLYVVDGHNLIGKISGLSLDMIDDEDQLLALLRPFVLARRGRQIEVFFDKAPVGYSGVRSFGSVRAHYVRTGKTADEAINQYLRQLGKAARGVKVVSSDHQVQASAREVHAEVILSETFAEELEMARQQAAAKSTAARKPFSALEEKEPKKGGRPDPAGRLAARSALSEAGMSDHELNEFLDMFHVTPAEADKPIETPPTSKKTRGSRPASTSQGAALPKETAKPRPKTKPRPHHGFPKKGAG